MKKSILIIEDDEFFRELVKKKLDSEGFEVFEATNGEAGVEVVKTKKPKLILLDLLLPTIDGFEVLTEVKADAATASIPVIILSNLGQKEDIDKGLKLGAVDYLIKSQFDIEQIVAKIKNILQ